MYSATAILIYSSFSLFFMDENTKERVHQIAKSLKELHLAANMEEALKRAREIVESTKENGKSIKELMGDIKEEAKELGKEAVHIEKESEKAREDFENTAQKEHKDTEHNIIEGQKTEASAKKTEEDIAFDVKVHKLEKGDVEEATREVDELDCATKDADYIVKEADKVRKKKK